MITITTAMIKALREATGAGPLDCKKALEASGGDVDAATAALREKGLAKAAQKAERETHAGLVVVKTAPGLAAAVEARCETDFVANTAAFRSLAHRLAEQVLADPAVTSGEAVLAAGYGAEPGTRVAEAVRALIGQLGENITLRAARYAAGAQSIVEGYIHGGGLEGEFGPQEGRVGVLVEVAGPAESAALGALAHDLALQITVGAPRYVSQADIPAEALNEQRVKLLEELAGESKPEPIKAKIVQGRLDKFAQAVCLVEQKYIKDDSLTIAQLLAQHGAALGTPVRVMRFVRFEPAA